MAEIESFSTRKYSWASFNNVFKLLLWPRRKRIFLGLCLVAVSRLSGLVLPYSSRILIDDVVTKENFSLDLLLLIVVLAITVQAISSFLLTQLLGIEAHRVIVSLRTQLQSHVLRLPISYFDSSRSGELVSRIMSDVAGVRNLLGTGLVQLIGGILQSTVALLVLISINRELALLALVPLALFGLVALKAFTYIRPIFRERNIIRADVAGRLTEALGAVRVIKGFNAEAAEDNIFELGARRLFKNVKKTLIATSLVGSSSVLLLGLASVIIIGVGGSMLIAGEISLGDFVGFTLILGYLVAPIFQMANIGTQMTEAFAGLDRMAEMLAEEQEGKEKKRSVELSRVHGEVIFDRVSFEYTAGNPVLTKISFTAAPNTTTALIGSSGSGKTTIAGLAASFLKPTAGRVLIDGTNLEQIILESYRSQLGVVLQDDFFFAGTIRENILFAKSAASEKELNRAVEVSHVGDFLDALPQGLDTMIGERGVKLSGGQRQRVAIARALLVDPRVLILDEATSNLDAESERLIQDSFQSLLKGRTTIVIAHRLSTIRKADQILVVERGEIIERGTHDTLISSRGRYYELYNYQTRI